MKIAKGVMLMTLAAVSLMLTCGAFAEEPVRGVVVDRNKDVLWLGLPSAVQRGAVFDVKLVPGGKVIARAEVIESTLDAPFVARARFAMEDPDAQIPVGAFVEATDDVIMDAVDLRNYRTLDLEPEDADKLSFQAGAFFPSDDSIADETTDVWPSFELKYRMAKTESAEVSLNVGYFHGDGSFTEGAVAGERVFRVLPLTVEAKLKTNKDKSGEGWFAKLAAGAYYIEDERTVGGVSANENEFTFGWKAGFGYESRSGRFVEVYYTDVSKTDWNGFVLSLGARF